MSKGEPGSFKAEIISSRVRLSFVDFTGMQFNININIIAAVSYVFDQIGESSRVYCNTVLYCIALCINLCNFRFKFNKNRVPRE